MIIINKSFIINYFMDMYVFFPFFFHLKDITDFYIIDKEKISLENLKVKIFSLFFF